MKRVVGWGVGAGKSWGGDRREKKSDKTGDSVDVGRIRRGRRGRKECLYERSRGEGEEEEETRNRLRGRGRGDA